MAIEAIQSKIWNMTLTYVDFRMLFVFFFIHLEPFLLNNPTRVHKMILKF